MNTTVWEREIGPFDFPLCSDFWPHGEVSRSYGVLREAAPLAGASERAFSSSIAADASPSARSTAQRTSAIFQKLSRPAKTLRDSPHCGSTKPLLLFQEPHENFPGRWSGVCSFDLSSQRRGLQSGRQQGATARSLVSAIPPRNSKPRQRFLAVPDPKLAEEHLRILTQAPHIAGSPEDKATADYVAQNSARPDSTPRSSNTESGSTIRPKSA